MQFAIWCFSSKTTAVYLSPHTNVLVVLFFHKYCTEFNRNYEINEKYEN